MNEKMKMRTQFTASNPVIHVYIAYKMMCVCRCLQSHSESRLLFLFICGLFVHLISIPFTRTASFFVLCILLFLSPFFFFCQVLHVVEFEQCSANQLYASLVVALLRPAGSANNIKERVSDNRAEANSR